MMRTDRTYIETETANDIAKNYEKDHKDRTVLKVEVNLVKGYVDITSVPKIISNKVDENHD